MVIPNVYKEMVRRIAKGDRKALCLPPQRQNLLSAYTGYDVETEQYGQNPLCADSGQSAPIVSRRMQDVPRNRPRAGQFHSTGKKQS